jgi:hypothetical protein
MLELGESALREEALKVLHGVGDPSLGEWHEWSGVAYHIRRRLTEREQTRVGDVVDVRGTPEGTRRLNAARPFMPAGMRERWYE